MPDNALFALFGLEMRRQVSYFRRGVLTIGGVTVLFYFVFDGGSRGLAMAAAFLGFSIAIFPTMNALPDKLDGTLEFLTSLPVPMDVLAAARLSACAVSALAAAILWTGGAGMAVQELLGVALGPGSYLAMFVALWLGATMVSALASGLIVRFSVEALARFPLVIAALFFGIPMALDWVAPGAPETILRWITGPRPPWLFFTFFIVAEALAVWLGFRLLLTGLERFRPPAARIAG